MDKSLKKIPSREITFVLQGPIISDGNTTKKSCESIRKYFPDSKIILSTWKNSNSQYLNIDEKIETEDPGANHLYYEDGKVLNNINRMIVSSLRGLVSSKTKFSVKLRSDMYLQSNNLLNLLGIINKTSCNYSRKKIIIPSNMAINPDRELKLLFHPSDNFFAGLTEDLIDLFDIPLMSENQMTYFKNNKVERKNNIPILSKYTCEQYLFLSFIKKKIKINLKNAFDFNKENKIIHDEVFSNLFAMYRNTKIGINGYKYPISFFSSSVYYAYTEKEFKSLSGEKIYFDYERVISNFIKILKVITLHLSKKFYLKLKNYFINKI